MARTVRDEIEAMLQPGYDPLASIVAGETERGFKVVRPGDAPWLTKADWQHDSVASLDGRKVRLVLLTSRKQGALGRTVRAIAAAGLGPRIIAPTVELETTLRRHGWAGVSMGHAFCDRETVWFPTPGIVW